MSVQWGFMKFKADAQKCFDEVQTLGAEYTPRQVINLAGFGLGIGSGRTSGYGRYHVIGVE